ncbi:MAG: PEP-utilizing enzyme [Anaerolineae bacterium]
MADSAKVHDTFFGDSDFPVTWEGEAEKQHFWFYDDLHIPNPVSPMYFDVGGWWGPTCEYLYRRFGAPFGKEWLAKKVNGYVYTAVMPRDPEEAGKISPYYGMVMSTYATNFLDWWNDRYLPEIKRNFEYLDNFPLDTASLPELMIHLEEALDIQERHFRIHWILNLAQFQSSIDFGGVVAEVIGEVDPALVGRILVSVEDRNWDSINRLWELKEQVKADPDLKAIFDGGETATAIRPALEASDRGQAFLADVEAYAQEFGYRAIHSHEYINKLWVEDTTPVIETIKGYLASDYDYPSQLEHVRTDQAAAIEELRALIPDSAGDEQRAKFEAALELALKMMPLTPDHHFYIDQGTYARLRLVFLGIGRHLARIGLLDDPEDIFYLEYEPLRWYVSNPKTGDNPDGFDGRAAIKQARRERDRAWQVRPRDWVGSANHWAVYEEPYHTLWGYPQRFEMAGEKSAEPADVIQGLAGSAGVVEGKARLVKGPEDFDRVQHGEIMVCVMTNPAWVVVFTKIAGLVTDAGGALAHPAVVAREFGIPAVVGTMDSTRRIKTGDRVRVNGSTGTVEIVAG